jgi:uncharacterized damage-inducible protein DinB
MMTPFLFERVSIALGGVPDTLEGLLGAIDRDDAVWDFRPFPERFTLREIVAHLVDLEPIWLDRFDRTQQTDGTVFERVDSSKLVIENNYAESDPVAKLAEFRAGRQKILQLITPFVENDWNKKSILPAPYGTQPLSFTAMFICVHDGYHTGQIAQWLAKWRNV